MAHTTPARLASLEARQAELEARIAALERQALEQAQRTVPWVGPNPAPSYPYPQPLGVDEARCPVCLALYKDLTHYVCNHPQCPSRITYGDVRMEGGKVIIGGRQDLIP